MTNQNPPKARSAGGPTARGNVPARGTGASVVEPSDSVDHHEGHDTHDDDRNKVGWKENALGSAQNSRVAAVSWGSIFAGVVTFLAIVLLFSLLTTALGIAGAGTGAAIVSVIGLLLAFFSGGAVAGMLSVRAGLIHGFLTWAGSLLAVVLLVTVLTLGAAGAVGGVLGSLVSGLGSAAGPALSQASPSDIPTPNASQSAAAQQAGEQAQQAAATAADATRTAATYGFFGLLLGAIVAAIAGLLGSRTVNNRRASRRNDRV